MSEMKTIDELAGIELTGAERRAMRAHAEANGETAKSFASAFKEAVAHETVRQLYEAHCLRVPPTDTLLMSGVRFHG